MGQDPKELTNVWCDRCHKLLGPKDVFVKLQTQSLYHGAKGFGLFICQRCLLDFFGILPASIEEAGRSFR